MFRRFPQKSMSVTDFIEQVPMKLNEKFYPLPRFNDNFLRDDIAFPESVFDDEKDYDIERLAIDQYAAQIAATSGATIAADSSTSSSLSSSSDTSGDLSNKPSSPENLAVSTAADESECKMADQQQQQKQDEDSVKLTSDFGIKFTNVVTIAEATGVKFTDSACYTTDASGRTCTAFPPSAKRAEHQFINGALHASSIDEKSDGHLKNDQLMVTSINHNHGGKPLATDQTDLVKPIPTAVAYHHLLFNGITSPLQPIPAVHSATDMAENGSTSTLISQSTKHLCTNANLAGKKKTGSSFLSNSFKLEDFELCQSGGSPFDAVELKTLNVLEELRQVLQPSVIGDVQPVVNNQHNRLGQTPAASATTNATAEYRSILNNDSR